MPQLPCARALTELPGPVARVQFRTPIWVYNVGLISKIVLAAAAGEGRPEALVDIDAGTQPPGAL